MLVEIRIMRMQIAQCLGVYLHGIIH
jgi:hypothetical protein